MWTNLRTEVVVSAKSNCRFHFITVWTNLRTEVVVSAKLNCRFYFLAVWINLKTEVVVSAKSNCRFHFLVVWPDLKTEVVVSVSRLRSLYPELDHGRRLSSHYVLWDDSPLELDPPQPQRLSDLSIETQKVDASLTTLCGGSRVPLGWISSLKYPDGREFLWSGVSVVTRAASGRLQWIF